MTYVCKSLTWWQTEVLVIELKWEPPLQETVGYLLPVIMGHHPDYLTVPIPVDVQLWNEQMWEDVYDLFMPKLTALRIPLDMESLQKERICSVLTSLASNAQSSSSTVGLPWYTTQWIIE
jgi:hypothetical protein